MKNFLLMCYLLFTIGSNAQNYKYKIFTKKDGLSSDIITCLAKDKKDFLWVGTTNGLNRFDGTAFDNFLYSPSDSNTIQNNEIQDILITDDNQVWVSTLNGISKFNEATKSFKNYAPDTTVLPKIGYAFPKLYKAKDGNIWVGTWYDLLIFNVKTNKFSSSGWGNFVLGLNIKNGNHTRVLIQSITTKSPSELWILSTYGLFSVNIFTKKFTYYENNYINDYYGSTIGYVNTNNDVYINTYNKGLVYYNYGEKQWNHFDIPITKQSKSNIINQVSGIQKFNGDTLIYCSNNQIFLFDVIKNKTLNQLLIEQLPSENLFSIKYNGILKYKKNIWVQSNNGLIQLSPFVAKFNEQPISNTQYLGRCFLTGNANELIMHDANYGIFYYNQLTKIKTNITIPKNQIIKEELSYYLKINKDTAYFTTENGLYLLVHNKAIAIPLPAKLIEQNPYITRNIVKDNESNLYIRCRKQGVVIFNTNTKKTNFLNCIPASENNEYTALYFDSDKNNLWIGLQNKGVYLYNTNTTKTIHHLLNTTPSLRGGSIYCILKSSKGDIYLSDMYNGIFEYNNTSNKFTQYSTKDGLLTNNCYWLSTYNDKMWIGTAAGISLMDVNTAEFKSFKLPVDNNNFFDYFLTDSLGNNYKAYENKIITWRTQNFISAEPKGKIYLRQCKLNMQILPEQKNYNFKYFENNIHFTIGYLLLNNENDVAFEHKLNDGNWTPISIDNKILFSNLSPNKYILQVRLISDIKQALQIEFIITPPFYKTQWFVLLIGICAAILLYLFLKNRINTIRKQASLKQKIAETEIMALKAQMNPHFIFNCISSIDNFILDNDAANASAYLNKFAKLIRNILDNSINNVIPFWKDWETLSYYIDLEKLRNNNAFECSITADSELLNGHYKIPPLIIQPYVENAILHGLKPLQNKKGLLEINASLKNEMLVYTIKDNGVGRSANQNSKPINATHTSYGMALTEQRINLFNANFKSIVDVVDLKDENGNNKGTLITIILSV